MMKRRSRSLTGSVVGCLLLVVAIASTANAQARGGSPDANLVSPEVSDSGSVTFNIYAPDASDVTVVGDWMTTRDPVALRKDAEGVWSVQVGSLNADFYSYTLRVDGVRTLDPRNHMIKHGNTSVDNMFLLPGDAVAYADNQRVPHGDIRKVWYESTTLEMQRRMHIYTPPGYDHNNDYYPVLHLLHGGGDEDSGWSTIGRAGYIIDNLLATNAALPMLVVMPNGSLPQGGDFTSELMNDVIPFVEAHYRARSDSENRAVAGLSMGGAQTTGVFSSHPDEFAYVAIWSAGLFNQPADEFAAQNREFLDQADRINENVKLLSISVGRDDFALAGSESLVDIFNRHGIEHEFNLTGGGHTWLNWRSYLHERARVVSLIDRRQRSMVEARLGPVWSRHRARRLPPAVPPGTAGEDRPTTRPRSRPHCRCREVRTSWLTLVQRQEKLVDIDQQESRVGASV